MTPFGKPVEPEVYNIMNKSLDSGLVLIGVSSFKDNKELVNISCPLNSWIKSPKSSSLIKIIADESLTMKFNRSSGYVGSSG